MYYRCCYYLLSLHPRVNTPQKETKIDLNGSQAMHIFVMNEIQVRRRPGGVEKALLSSLDFSPADVFVEHRSKAFK